MFFDVSVRKLHFELPQQPPSRFAVVDNYGTVQPSGGVTLGANGTYSFAISLQASRLGTDQNGRTYTITVSAHDNAGNQSSSSTAVVVPHDQGH